MPFVYILSSRSRNAIYIGSAIDLRKRVEQHRNGEGKAHTKTYRIELLVYFEIHETLEAARTRERSMKRWKRAWKDELIENINPAWQDITDQIPL